MNRKILQKMLHLMGLNSTAKSLSGGVNLLQNGGKFNLGNIGANLKSDIFGNIKELDNKLRDGIVRSFKELPSNISKSAIALKDWTINSVKAIPSNFMAGLNGLKFIKGNGDYIGIFVIEEIGQTVEQTTPEGDLLSVQIDARLKEYAGKIIEEDEQKGFRKKQ